MSKSWKSTMTLRQFILCQEVKNLYHDVFKVIYMVKDKNTRNELRQWARHDFRIDVDKCDDSTIKLKLQQGRRNLNNLKRDLMLSGVITEPISEKNEVPKKPKPNTDEQK